MTLEYIPDNDLINTYLEASASNQAPDLLLTTSSNLQSLVEANTVYTIDRNLMQAFSPISQATVSINGVAYGIPVALIGNVFYYNTDLVSDAPVTTDELLVESSAPFAVSRSSGDMFWTLTAYNGIVLSNDTVVPDVDQLNAWLTWLAQVDDTEHIDIVSNNFLRRNRFVDGESAYYVDSSLAVLDLSQAMDDSLAVAPFPTGTSQFASPQITSVALFINPRADSVESSLAFADTLTTVSEQETMAETLRWIPANITANQTIATDPLLSAIADVIQRGIVINRDADILLAEVSQAIDTVFRGEQTVDVIAQGLFDKLSTGEAGE